MGRRLNKGRVAVISDWAVSRMFVCIFCHVPPGIKDLGFYNFCSWRYGLRNNKLTSAGLVCGLIMVIIRVTI